jgi:signal transduction histidine kinase
VDLAWRRHLPPLTVRLRLTALYALLFLVSGAVLLAATYLLVDSTTGSLMTRLPPFGAHARPAGETRGFAAGVLLDGRSAAQLLASQRASDLHQLLLWSGLALAVMTVLSAALGWLVAGRVLRPLRTMTAATRRISENSLHDRLALEGPRDELRQLADTIDGLLARLEAAFEAQRRFVANAAHELRTPLAGMRVSLDVAMRKPGRPPPRLVALDERLRHGFDHLEDLLESFLALARAQRAAPSDETTASLGDLASTALERRKQDITQLELTIEDEPPADAFVTGSETLLARMIQNVIGNAIDHNQQGGWIRISHPTDQHNARLVVENSGQPIPAAEVTRLAQPFRRLGAPRTGSQNGTGLGLSIVAAIVEAHGGTLDLHAADQGGLRVLIALPLSPHPRTRPVPVGALS